MLALDGLLSAARNAWRPPPKLTLSQWAESHAYLSEESSAEAGKWHNIPYQVGIMDAFTDPEVERITCMKSARVGWTKILNNVAGYFIHQDPCPIMIVQPTIEDAEGYSKEEIAPMIRDTPVLRELVSESKAKDSGNTILQKLFPGGSLSMVGANSPRGFRRVSRRVVMFDEVDGYPASAGAEGDQIKLGIKRTEYYWNRKIADGSTPTIADHSRVEKSYLASDQRRYFVPCPHCGEEQFLKWGGQDAKFGIKWPEGEPDKAYYVCEHNGCIIDHSAKRGMIEQGRWLATKPENGPKHAGFHIWAAYSYSPNATWGNLATEFLAAKEDPEELKTFVNTALGECWTETFTAKLGAEGLAARVEEYSLLTCPARCLLLTAAIDVQDNRLAVKVKGWGEGEESWLINWMEIFGDPSDLSKDGPWHQALNVLTQPYPHELGRSLKVRATAVDTGGHFTNEAYMFCRLNKRRGVFAIKGSSKEGKPVLGKPSKQDVNWKGQTIASGVELRMVGTDTVKATVYGRIKRGAKDGPGAYHWPLNISAAIEYFKQLTSEKQLPKYRNGQKYLVWVKKDKDRNEALDCEVYCYAALHFLYTKVNRNTIWLQAKSLLDRLDPMDGGSAAAGASPSQENGLLPPSPPPTKSSPTRRPRRGGFVKNWRQ